MKKKIKSIQFNTIQILRLQNKNSSTSPHVFWTGSQPVGEKLCSLSLLLINLCQQDYLWSPALAPPASTKLKNKQLNQTPRLMAECTRDHYSSSRIASMLLLSVNNQITQIVSSGHDRDPAQSILRDLYSLSTGIPIETRKVFFLQFTQGLSGAYIHTGTPFTTGRCAVADFVSLEQ